MSQVLSQEEIDELLRGVKDTGSDQDIQSNVDGSGVSLYDLTSQERIIRGRMPTLDIINQRFSRIFRNSLSSALRRVLDISTVSTDTIKFGEFVKSLPLPASLHIFKMEPLRGFALLVAESKLVFALVDIFFGGNGESEMKVEGRDFTTIEQRIIKKIVMMTLADMETAWKPVHDLKLSFVRSEVNPQFAAIIPPTDVIVSVKFEIELDLLRGSMTVCLPYSTIEPIIGKLKAGFQSDQLEVDHAWINRLKDRITDAHVELTAEIGITEITSEQLVCLKAGDIISLDTDIDQDIVVTVEGIPKFKALPGVIKSNRAVKIIKKIRSSGTGDESNYIENKKIETSPEKKLLTSDMNNE